ncbi:MAG TPA: hypothetical protein VHC68_01390 [Candidatus Paceibacterota bacterium]|nr:hypothetical protein [Candidatus Paceibacterota bacterium]
MSSSDDIELSEAQFNEFYENFGSNSFQLQGRVLEDLGTKQLDIYFKSIGFATTVIGVVGLIAGFGFTALDHVESMALFFFGEVLLLGGLFYGLFWTQQKYQAEFKSLEEERKKLAAFYEKRNGKFMELYNKWISERRISRTAFVELNEIDKGSIELFRTEKDRPIPSIYSQAMYILMIAGTVVLLSSFFICLNTKNNPRPGGLDNFYWGRLK